MNQMGTPPSTGSLPRSRGKDHQHTIVYKPIDYREKLRELGQGAGKEGVGGIHNACLAAALTGF